VNELGVSRPEYKFTIQTVETLVEGGRYILEVEYLFHYIACVIYLGNQHVPYHQSACILSDIWVRFSVTSAHKSSSTFSPSS